VPQEALHRGIPMRSLLPRRPFARTDGPFLVQLPSLMRWQRVPYWRQLSRRGIARTMHCHSSNSAKLRCRCRAQKPRCGYHTHSLRVTPSAVRRGIPSQTTLRHSTIYDTGRRSCLARKRRDDLLTMKRPPGRCRVRVARLKIPSGTPSW
jgi:hypothetical protein